MTIFQLKQLASTSVHAAADAMGWDVPAEGSGFWQTSAKMLLSRGYK